MNNIKAATKIQSLTRGHLARKAIKQQKQNNAATKIQSVYRGHKVRKDLATLYNWVNEAPEEEHEVRQRVKDLIQIVNGRLEVNGDLNLRESNISSLPQGLHLRGDLNLFRCTGLKTLPQGLHVGGDLDLNGCTNLSTLPQGLQVGGDLYLSGCTSLTELPQGLHVGGDLDLRNCFSLTELPQGLHVGGDLYLRDCTSLTSLPQGLTVERDLWLCGCTSLIELPQGLHVGRNLSLYYTSLQTLPDWTFNVSDLEHVPDHLQQTNTYKIFQILKHFDTHNTISDINNQELIDLYNQNKDRINTLINNRHCFRIAHALYNNNQLTPQQQVFKNSDNEQTKNQIRDHIRHMLTPNQLLTINDIDSNLEFFKEHFESTVCAHDIPELQRLSLLSLKKHFDSDSLSNLLTYPLVSTHSHYQTFLDTPLDLLEFSHSKLKLWDIQNNAATAIQKQIRGFLVRRNNQQQADSN